MAEHCLTVTVNGGLGGDAFVLGDTTYYTTVCQTDGVSPTSCARNYPEGFPVPIVLNPDSDWSLYKWELRDSSSGLMTPTITSLISGNDSDPTSFLLEMPSENCTLTVFFNHTNFNVSLWAKVGSTITDIGGCIEITGSYPSGLGNGLPCRGGNISVTYGSTIYLHMSPKAGYQIQSVLFDGVSQTVSDRTNFSDALVNIVAATEVIVNYELTTTCDTYHLTASVEGRGSVSPSSGDYCQGTTLSLTPVPAGGYRFKNWDYTFGDPDISLIGIVLYVNMESDKTVKAIFESLDIIDPEVVPESPNIFYCPSQEYKSHLVAFNYTNASSTDYFHFRVNFYGDESRSAIVYSAFSLIDTKRWYYDDGSIWPMPDDGVLIPSGYTYKILFDPEVMPQNLTEQQREYLINHDISLVGLTDLEAYKILFGEEGPPSGLLPEQETALQNYYSTIHETPLICGSRYYVSIEVYDSSDKAMTFVKNIDLLINCDIADGFHWNEDKDKTNWICSGQGLTDLKVSDSSDYSVNSAVSSNSFNLFCVVWQGHRGTSDSVYGAMWDSEEDSLYASGQGLFDKQYLSGGRKPVILTDQASNFYVAANSQADIKFDACPLPVSIPSVVSESEDAVFEAIGRPGESSYLGTSFGDFKADVYGPDVSGSLVINNEKVVSVVTKLNIRLDLLGIEGTYAVRLRNSESMDWGEWILIDDPDKDIVKIDNNRLIVPCTLSRINGIRRVCCRVLTMYGISKTFCIDVFLNMDPLEYTFKFYSDAERENPAPTYKGMPVLTGTETETGTKWYFSTIFSEPLYKDASTKTEYADGEIKFNIIQQGINEVYSQLLTKVNNTTYNGEFFVHKNDGIFNKDGKAFIQLVFPDSLSQSSGESDTTDMYNLMINSTDAVKYQNLSPEQIYADAVTSQIGKVSSIVPFGQYYNKDDVNLKFGSPNYYKEE